MICSVAWGKITYNEQVFMKVWWLCTSDPNTYKCRALFFCSKCGSSSQTFINTLVMRCLSCRGAKPKKNIFEIRERVKQAYGLSDYDASVLTASKELGIYYEEVVKGSGNAKSAANWVMNELLGRLNAASIEIDKSPVSSKHLGSLVQAIESGEISGKIAKTVFDEMMTTSKDPKVIIQEKGLVQISDTGQLDAAIQKVIAANPGQTADYKAGKVKLLGFFVGQVMKETKGQANPAMLNDLVKKALDK